MRHEEFMGDSTAAPETARSAKLQGDETSLGISSANPHKPHGHRSRREKKPSLQQDTQRSFVMTVYVCMHVCV